MPEAKAHPCPICKTPVLPGTEARATWPFCSKRCRTIDLGQWLSGGYVIPGETPPREPGTDPEDDR